MQYQIGGIDSSKWKDTTSGSRIGGLHHNDTVYGRLWDGVNESEPASIDILDKINQIIKEIKPIEVTENIIKVRVDAQDLESGISKIEYSSDNGINYTTGETDIGTEYIFENLEEVTEYTIKVRVTDKAGNKTESNAKITTIGGATWDGKNNEQVEAVVSEDKIVVPVPRGYTASKATGEKSVSTGFVIYEGVEEVTDINLEEAKINRNQFVWVPVPGVNKMATKISGTDSKGRQNYQGKLYDFTEGKSTEKTNYGIGTTSFR